MSDIFVPPNDREQFEESFIDQHPALGLKPTSNSGAYWGDGDARPQAVQENQMTFAVEMKTRKSKKLTPRASEYAKAFGEDGTGGQLAKFDSRAFRLLAVYSLEKSTYAVSIPNSDAEPLMATLGLRDELDNTTVMSLGEERNVRRNGQRLYYQFFDWMDWKSLYEHISDYASEPS